MPAMLPLSTESVPDTALVETARLPRGSSRKTSESGATVALLTSQPKSRF